MNYSVTSYRASCFRLSLLPPCANSPRSRNALAPMMVQWRMRSKPSDASCSGSASSGTSTKHLTKSYSAILPGTARGKTAPTKNNLYYSSYLAAKNGFCSLSYFSSETIKAIIEIAVGTNHFIHSIIAAFRSAFVFFLRFIKYVCPS